VTAPTVTALSVARITPLAPAYYLGHPAQQWVEALHPNRRPHQLPIRVAEPAAAAA
jgi:hypothetical protein